MDKLNYSDIKNQQLVDLRSQNDYQKGYVENSINLNPKNLKKYAADFLSFDHRVVLITDQTIEDLDQLAESLIDHIHIEGYIDINDFPDEDILTVDTISAGDFLDKEDDYILLDVRHPDEITRIAPKKNLLNIPLEKLPESLKHIDKDKEIYTLCGSGNRGTTTASYLIKEGYDSTVIEGGMKAIEESRSSD